MDSLFHEMIESAKTDDVDELRTQFEQIFAKNLIVYLHFSPPSDIFLPLQSFLFDVAVTMEAEKCYTYLLNEVQVHKKSIEEAKSIQNAKEKEKEQENIKNNETQENPENNEVKKELRKEVNNEDNNGDNNEEEEEDNNQVIIDIKDDDVEVMTMLTLISSNDQKEETEEDKEETFVDDYTTLTDWYIRTHFNEDEYPETVYDAFYIAANSNLKSVVEYLLSYGIDAARVSKYGSTIFNGFVFKKNYDMIELFTKYNVKQTGDINGRFPLHVSAKTKDDEMAKYLIEIGGDLDVKDEEYGFSPLHLAAKLGAYEVAYVFLENGAQYNLEDFGGRTPMHIAAAYGQTSVCELLYESGAAVEIIDKDGMTPMNLATARKKKACERYFESLGLNNTNMENDKYMKKRKSNKIQFEVAAKKRGK